MSVNALKSEPRWHASIAVVLALALYVTLPPKVTYGPLWLFPLIVLGLLIPLSLFAPDRKEETTLQRVASISVIAFVNLFNLVSVFLLVYFLIHPSQHHRAETGGQLLLAGIQIWLTNILVFALWYWELDSDGPEARARGSSAADFENPDFQFPQMLGGQDGPICVKSGWKPLFIDYAFLAFNTATALSPADTMPLSRLAKMLMMTESVISFATIAVIVSRSINILG
ncbi:MAG: hypothetical protein NVSMB31_04730 [Vulcanimicrobiaceae bacterium]